jgi:anti-sigma factor RsiW
MGKGCKAYAVDLSAYFDGELEGAPLQAMETHLAACEGCRDTLQRLARLRSALHAMTRPTGRRGRSVLEDLKARLADEDPDGEAGDDPLMS